MDNPSITLAPCKGTNCGATDGVSHSAKCRAEHDALCNAAEQADNPSITQRLAEALEELFGADMEHVLMGDGKPDQIEAIAKAHAALAAYAASRAEPTAGERVADAATKALYVQVHGTDKGWLGIEGSYFISGVQAGRAAPKPIAKLHSDGYWTAMPGFKEPLNFSSMEVYAAAPPQAKGEPTLAAQEPGEGMRLCGGCRLFMTPKCPSESHSNITGRWSGPSTESLGCLKWEDRLAAPPPTLTKD